MAPQLTQVERERIIALRQSGCRIIDICRQTGITRKTVYFWLRRWQESGTLAAHHRQLYARATTAADDAAMVAAHSANPFLSTRQTSTSYSISMDTVRRRLKDAGKKCCRPAKKILMNQAHKEARVSFCLEHYNFDWTNNIVIFVDEKSFRSDIDGRKILWRNSNERYVEVNTLPNRASGRISLNFWGWMSSMGPGELVEVSGRMTGDQYVEILRDVMIPTVRLHYPEGIIYLCQDNCRVHTCRVVQNWLATQEDVVCLPWPAKSPDLNPIENLWGLMVLD